MKTLLVTVSILLLCSCSSRKKVVYFSDIEQQKTESLRPYEVRLQPDDLLSIIINSNSEELLSNFNKSTNPGSTLTSSIQTYLIDQEGYIVFPTIGSIKLAGLTKKEAIELLTDAIKPYITDATVNLKITNFKVTVQGEVLRPGTFTINSERVTLLQALSLAGDLTIYGKRDRVVVIREHNNQRTYNVVDLTASNFMDSDYYFLNQNDIVYVEPNKTRINSSVVGANTSTILSAISVLVAIIGLMLR